MNHWIVKKIQEEKIIAILRGIPLEDIGATAEALYEGGIRLLEITFNQNSENRLKETAKAISLVKKMYGESMQIGAGTVLSREEVNVAVDAGAGFILSPNVDEEVICYGCDRGMEMIPGAMTPSEVMTAYNAGAPIVKLFPAGNLGEPYCKAIFGPINQVPMIAVGGIDLGNLESFLKLGFVGAGIGSNLTPNNLIHNGRFSELKELASAYVAAARLN